MLNNWFKKEKPIQGMMGFGGGATGNLVGGGGGGFVASGGIETEANGMKFHRFVTPGGGRGNSSHNFTVVSGSAKCNIMVQGGGGAGGYANEGHGGGGAGGQVDLPESAPQNVALAPGNYPINVGNGGSSAVGGDSTFGGAPFGTLTGKGGGRYSPGGCGGGGRGDSGACTSGTQPGQPGLSGNYGHGYGSGCGVGPEQGEGGGGTAQQGGNSGQNGYGGAGRKPPWIPTSGFGDQGRFGGGGGAGVRSPGPSGGPGGAGGGGRGYQNNRQPDINGLNGLGGGAGGGQESGVSPGAGGSGCVIIAYPI